MFSRSIPLSLYVHIPWCVRKCPYCDFNSHAQNGELPETEYIDAVMRDLAADLQLTGLREVQSIFIGGGTPSLFSAQAIDRLLAEIRDQVVLADGAEITMEANPGTFEQDRFAGFKAAGVNRLSLGVQSFDDACLKSLGRIHSAEEAQKAFVKARQIGFDNINIDLMHGLPGQSLETAQSDLQQALALAPEHLSWYQLTIEPNTEFYVRPPSLPVDDTLWDIQEMGWQLLADNGYQQYEISAYAKPGRQAVHNLNYWQFGDYIGIGAGAHGKLTLADGHVVRRWKQRQPKAYMTKEILSGEDAIAVNELPFEFMMNALRLSEGVASELFVQRTGLPLSTLEPLLVDVRKKGLLVEDGERLAPTKQGRLFLNDLLASFLAD